MRGSALPCSSLRATTFPSTRPFIRDLLARKPQIVDEQKRGRAIWWDKAPRELAERKTMDEGRVPQPPYVYQPE